MPGLRGHLLEVALGALHALAQALAAAAHDRVEPVHAPRGTLAAVLPHRAHDARSRGNGAGVDRDDAAGGEHVADLRQARALHLGGERRRAGEALDRVGQVGVGAARSCAGRGAALARARRASAPASAPERGHDAVEPEPVEERQRRARGRRDLEHHHAAAGAHDARHLRQPAGEVVEVARAEADGRGVEASRRRRAAPARRPTRSAGARRSRPRRAPWRARGRACPRRSRCRPPRRPATRAARARSPDRRCRWRRRARGCRGRRARARPRARASGGAGRRSSPCSSGHTRPRCGRTSRAPGPPPALPAPVAARGERARPRLLELRQEVDDRFELLRRQVLERRHRRRRVHERARDRLAREPRADVRQVGPGPGVAVVADLVARQAARLGDDLLARFVFGEQRRRRPA